MATEAKVFTLRFEFDKETKNKKRFQEVSNPDTFDIIGTLYVSKEELKQIGDPSVLIVTIKPGN